MLYFLLIVSKNTKTMNKNECNLLFLFCLSNRENKIQFCSFYHILASGQMLPLPGDSEEGSDELPPVRFGVHVHAEVHGSLQESTELINFT